MKHLFVEEKTFDREDFLKNRLEKGQYELCTFLNCNFLNANLSEIQFIDCEFYDCDLSMANLSQTIINNVLFKDCKMLGLHFEKCSDFTFSMKVENCQLNDASFYHQKISKTVFTKCKMQEVDFTECDLSFSVFNDCDLLNAIFDNTNLKGADLRNSFNFTIDPEKNQIKGAKFSLQSVSGLLAKYHIKIDPN
ncbi:pentapeptide repeat-containing protein [Lutibacter sp. HS1-25]|uniref:pentapeptide repeat-containing protein n=1 Tax=Lutibacter sp. HS1-25 TaxID=2485000 RepID=UPI00101180AB|nr:pentapeptide repeat-containing protein [Lutibacter sp. HS1-25]RXP55755.1 pentapeptide repeat-containing protein [Lutibacter sp. HS1-25]